MTSINEILTDASKAPLAEVLLTYGGLLVLGLFSWATKTWFCHRDKDLFMKREKRIIDELCGVSGGILLFCAIAAVQFIARTTFVAYQNAGNEIVINVPRANLAIELVVLSMWSIVMFIATTAFRNVLGKIDYKLNLEASGDLHIPPAVDFPFPNRTKQLILVTLTAIMVFQAKWMANVFASHLDLLHN